MFAVKINYTRTNGTPAQPRLVSPSDFGGKHVRGVEVRTWKTRAGAERFAKGLHASANAVVVEA